MFFTLRTAQKINKDKVLTTSPTSSQSSSIFCNKVKFDYHWYSYKSIANALSVHFHASQYQIQQSGFHSANFGID